MNKKMNLSNPDSPLQQKCQLREPMIFFRSEEAAMAYGNRIERFNNLPYGEMPDDSDLPVEMRPLIYPLLPCTEDDVVAVPSLKYKEKIIDETQSAVPSLIKPIGEFDSESEKSEYSEPFKTKDIISALDSIADSEENSHCSVNTADERDNSDTIAQASNKNKLTALDVTKKFLSMVNTIVLNDKVYIYNGSYYRLQRRLDVERQIMTMCEAEIASVGSPHFVSNVYDFILKHKSILIAEEELPHHLLSLHNGVLNVQNRQLYTHSPKHHTLYSVNGVFLTSIIPQCPHFDVFLNSITHDDQELIQRIWECIGYILSPDTSAKVFFLFQGVPNSGKSVLSTLISKLLSDDSVMTLDAHVFSDKFSLADLRGKALCISPDLPSEPLNSKSVSKIKQLTGNDVVSTDVKYQSRQSFRCTAKFILATNHPLLCKTVDEAFYDRIVTIPFQYSVPREFQNRNQLDEILSEKDAIITKALNAYFYLVDNRYKFSGTYLPNEVVMNNSMCSVDYKAIIYTFVAEHLTADPDGVVYTCIAHEKYVNLYGYISVNEFSHWFCTFAIERFNVKKDRKRMDGGLNPISCLVGVRLL